MDPSLFLPPELWSIALQNLRSRKSQPELTYLWTTVRHVSRQFMHEVEDIFVEEHLPKVWLRIESSEFSIFSMLLGLRSMRLERIFCLAMKLMSSCLIEVSIQDL